MRSSPRSAKRAHEQPAEDEAKTPVQQRREHADRRDEADGAAARGRHPREAMDQDRRRRRRRDDIAADRDERHLHGERDEAPEAVAERHADGSGRSAVEHRRRRDDDDRDRHEHERVGEPLSAHAVKPIATRARKPSRAVEVSVGSVALGVAMRSSCPSSKRHRLDSPGDYERCSAPPRGAGIADAHGSTVIEETPSESCCRPLAARWCASVLVPARQP